MVPSIWKQRVVIPVPKKRGQGPCVTDDYCDISVVSVHEDNVYDCKGKTGSI